MFRRTRTPLSRLCLALFLAVSLGAGRPSEPGPAIANGPAALSGANIEPPEDALDTIDAADSLPARQAPGTEPKPDQPAAKSPAADDGSSPGIETRSLGEPNSALSARPAEGPLREMDENPLAALDPRQNEVTRVFAALAVVLGLLILLRLFLKRASSLLAGGGRPSGVLEILARYPVGRGQSLMILKMARRVLLVHQAGSSMSTLTQVTDAEEVAALLARMEAGARSREAARFKAALRTFQDEHERLATHRFPPGEESGPERAEIVDLTRGRAGGLGALLRRWRAPA
jgi:flagellar biogenesis protein FliO